MSSAEARSLSSPEPRNSLPTSPLPFSLPSFYDDLFDPDRLDPGAEDTPTPRSLSVQSAMNTAFIDLTGDSSPPPPPPPPPRASSHHSSHSNSEPARKRRRIDEGESSTAATSASVLPQARSQPVTQLDFDFEDFIDIDAEEVDLTRVEGQNDLEELRREQKIAEQQRQLLLNESLAAQNSASAGTGKLSDLSCIICMESMTDLTVTHCGHLFCHTCIMEALIAGENQSSEPGKGSSRCPVCRKKVARTGRGRETHQVIPLELKLRKKQSEVAKGKQKEVIDDPGIGD